MATSMQSDSSDQPADRLHEVGAEVDGVDVEEDVVLADMAGALVAQSPREVRIITSSVGDEYLHPLPRGAMEARTTMNARAMMTTIVTATRLERCDNSIALATSPALLAARALQAIA